MGKVSLVLLVLAYCTMAYTSDHGLYDRNHRKITEKKQAREQFYLNCTPHPDSAEEQQDENDENFDEDEE